MHIESLDIETVFASASNLTYVNTCEAQPIFFGDPFLPLRLEQPTDIYSSSENHCPVLVLDIEEVLLRVSEFPSPGYDHLLQYEANETHFQFYVQYRLGLIEFLQTAATQFELVLYSAATREFVDAVLANIDPCNNFFSDSFSRDECYSSLEHYQRDLMKVGRERENIISIEVSHSLRYADCTLILPWLGGSADTGLITLTGLLQTDFDPSDILKSLVILKNKLAKYQKL